MEAKNEDSDDSEYQKIFAALDELKLVFLRSFFKTHLLEDDTLFYMQSEEELRNELQKLSLPFGQAFKVSRHWFNKCHKLKETVTNSKNSGDANYESQEVLSESATTLSKNFHQDDEKSSLKKPQDSTENNQALLSCDVKEKRDSVGREKTKTQQGGKEDQFERQSTLEKPNVIRQDKKDFTSSSNVEGILLKEDPLDGDNQSVQHTTSKESQEQNKEGNRATSNENFEIFPTTTIDKNQYEDGTQQGTYLFARTVSPENPPSSSKQKGAENNKKQPKGAGKVQSKNENKHTPKGAVSTDSTQQDGGAEYEHDESISDNVIPCIPKSDTNNNHRTEKPSSSDADCVASRSTGISVTEEPNRTVEKVPSVPTTSSSTMPQIAGLPATCLRKGGAKKQNLLAEEHDVQSVQVSKCTGRPFGAKVAEHNTNYKKGSVLDAEENKEVEYKSFSSAHPSILPWKMMEKAKKFICACLNADSRGIIYFGVGDNQEQGSKFNHGEIIGLEVENIKDDIVKALQTLLDEHIKSDDGPLQKGGEQNCINIHFVPVECQENRSNLYVVEIEVSRDWRFCKDNVYHSKTWIEKQGGGKDSKGKKGLNDLFKVKADSLDDIAIRTKGASVCVKQNEVKRQVREPLVTKYKEWKREAKFGASELSNGFNPDDPDFKRINKTVRERLFHLNFKEYHFILVANKVPPQYRGTPHLSFLQSIPWVAVFDLFDASSKTDGLHFICNEMNDAPRANIKTLDDFNDIFSDWAANKNCPLSTRGTTWIFQPTKLQGEEWITCSAKDCFYRALSAYKDRFPSGKLIIAILGLGENAIMEMSDIVESCFSILGGGIAKKCVTIISESKAILDAFIKNSKLALRKQLVDCSITDISWNLLKEIVREMVGPNEFKEKEATTKLPYITGEREVLNKIIHSWDDLEVYCPEPRLPNLTEDIEKARDAFYKGTQASQVNLFYNHTIERTLEEEIIQKVEQAMKSLGNPSGDRTSSVKTINVPYEPGSGATTMCRRILWSKRKNYRCAVIKAITKATDFQIEQLQSIGYYEEQQHSSPPVLVLVDNFPELDNVLLSEQLTKRETKCIIIATYPVETTGTTIEFEIKPLRQLDDTEMSHVRNILINITRDSGRRREAEEVLEREKRFIWFGLELFGREYVQIKERLQKHIKSTLVFLGASQARHEKLLNFCCFLHFYSNGAYILPHSFVVDFLYEGRDEADKRCAQTSSIHEKFGGLLLEGFNESYGYHGWRPAHSLVSEVVKSRMNVDEIAVQLLENAENGKAYANKYLWEQLFQILLHRKRVSNLISLPQDEETPGESEIANEEQKCYETRTRYSPLILDINAGDDGQRRTLEFLITVCQKANQTEDKTYAWQQLARFLGYEMRFKQLESKDALHSRLHDAINLSKGEEHQLPMPENGIKAAHIAIDIAIDQRRKYSHHYTTKGGLYVLQLRDVNTKDEHNLVTSMPDVIDIGRKALKVYDQAIQRMSGLNFYPVIGKIQVIVLLLKIFKSLPCFGLENNSFTRYLEVGEIPREMEDFLQQEDHSFVQSLGRTTFNLLNELFKDVKYRQLTTCDDSEFRNLSTTNTRACKLREEFYDITGFDRSKLVPTEESLSPLSKKAPDIIQQVVQDILFKNNETSYSGWYNLDNQVVSSIYRLLRPLCLNDNGSHDDMLIFSRVCLRLLSQEKPSVDELDNVVQTWVKKFPDSAWAHLFNYMIHFPIPNRSLLPTNLLTLASINKCCEMVQRRTGWRARKSAAEYFLGKGTGLIAIVSRQEFPELEKKWWQTKTDFWRSKEVSETLIRVRGQKLSQGVITYQGIRLRFDDMLYPSESKDDLWFYVGFSVAGPYAFDPVDDDTYSVMIRKREKKKLPFKRVPNDVGRNAVSFDSQLRRKPRKMGNSTQRNSDNWELVDEDVGFTLDRKRAKTALKKRSFRATTNAVKCGPTCMAGPGRQKSRKIGSAIQTNVDPSERCPTTPFGQNVQVQLPSRNSNVPRAHMSSLFPRSTAFSTRSPLTRGDNPAYNMQRPPAAETLPSSAELENREDSQEKDIPNAEIHPPEVSGVQKAAQKGVASVVGQCSQKQCGRGRGIHITPQATDDFPVTSLGRKYREQLPSGHSNVPRELVNSSPCPKSTDLSTRSALTIGDNLQRPAAAETSPSSTELKNRVASQEKYVPNADIQAPKLAVAQKAASYAVRPGAVSLVGQSSLKPCGRGRGMQNSLHASQDFSTASFGQNSLEQLSSALLDVQREFMEPSSSSRSTAFSTQSPLAINYNLQGPAATAIMPLCASQVRKAEASQEKGIANVDCQSSEASMAKKSASNAVGSVAIGRGLRKPRGRGRGIQKIPLASQDCLTSSPGRNVQEKLPSKNFNVPDGFMNSSSCFTSASLSTPLTCDNNPLGPAATAPALKHGRTSQEKEVPGSDSQPFEGSMVQPSALNTVGPGGVSVADRGSHKLRGMGSSLQRRLAATAPTLKHGGASHDEEVPNSDSRQPLASVTQKALSNAVRPGTISVVGQGGQNPPEMSIGTLRNPHVSGDCLTTSLGQNFLEQLPSEHFNVPKGDMNSPSCSRSTTLSTRSLLVSDNNLQRPVANPIPLSSGSASAHGGASQKNEIVNTDSQPSETSGGVSVTGQSSQTPREMEMGRGIQRSLDLDASEYCLTTSLPQNENKRVDVSRGVMKSPPCYKSTAVSTQSSLANDDNLHKAATTAIPLSYASALKHGGASQGKEIPNDDRDRQPPEASETQTGINWKSIKVTRGEQSRVFEPMFVDQKGKLHHGSRVLGAVKSQECRIHTSTISLRNIDRCTFAHSWRGDTIQSVCTKCTEENKSVCREKKEHEQFIWNLGPYYTEYGNIWKASSGQELSK